MSKKKLTRKERKLLKLKKLIPENIIRLHKNKTRSNYFDVDLLKNKELNKYKSLECHVVFYPYNRGVFADDFAIYPFEEYIKDISTGQRSAYIKKVSNFNKFFGIILSIIIILVVLFALNLNADALFGVEAIASIIGAYIVGKELWDDIEKILIRMTRNWKIRYQESYYQYEQSKHTTLTLYSSFAKKYRYNKTSLLPDKIDFIPHSNSKTVRMMYDNKKLKDIDADSFIHMLSIHINPRKVENLEKYGYLFGIKLSFNKHFLFFTNRFEVFQSMSKDEKGCLNLEGEWIKNGVLYRKTRSLGKIKHYRKHGIIEDISMMNKVVE